MKNLLSKALMVTLCLAMVLQLAACGGDSGGKKEEEPAGPQRVEGLLFEEREVENANIKMLIFYPPNSDIKEINSLYHKTYGGTVDIIEKQWDAKTATVSSYVASGNPCEVVLLVDSDIPTFSAQGMLDVIPMDKLDADSPYLDYEYMNGNGKYKDNTYVIAYEDTTGTRFYPLVYNAKLFEKYGVKTPYEHFKAGNWDYDQFRKTAAEMTVDTDDDGFVDLFGFDASLKVFGRLFYANAVQPLTYVNNKYSLNLDDPRILESYQLYSDMYNIDKSINQTEFKEYQNFLNGRAAMVSVGIEYYAQCYLDGMEKGTAELGIFPCGPSANGKYFSYSTGHTFIGSVKGTNNLDATIAWAECAISVWLELAQDSPREVLDYYWNEEERARIDEFNSTVILFSESGLKHNAQGVQGSGYTTANWLTAQSMMVEIRKNVSVKTVIEKFKPTLQGQLDNVNAILAGTAAQ
ncbi:MAG: carbohydrate ABC transporter substrate-binding protein [Clostridia bacterium]|nr:carbohydrate ABC transporter substrate-binding protein [Clostridia bacterium]